MKGVEGASGGCTRVRIIREKKNGDCESLGKRAKGGRETERGEASGVLTLLIFFPVLSSLVNVLSTWINDISFFRYERGRGQGGGGACDRHSTRKKAKKIEDDEIRKIKIK